MRKQKGLSGIEKLIVAKEKGNPKAMIKCVNEYLEQVGKQTIRSLDDVNTYNSAEILSRIIGFKHNSPKSFKRALIESDVFSESLLDYPQTDKEYIVNNVIMKFSNSTISHYFSESLSNYILEENRKIFAKSDLFKRYLAEQGIKSLDDIQRKNVSSGISTALGSNIHQPTTLKKKLVEYGVFSLSLSEYPKEDIEHIVEKIIKEPPGYRFKSVYFSESLDKEVLEYDRRIFANSKAFKRYLAEQGIKSLDDIMESHVISRFSLIFKIRRRSPESFKEKLIKYGTLNLSLSRYSHNEVKNICENIISKLQHNRFHSTYFSKSISKEVLESNRRTFATSKAFKRYLHKKGIRSLDDVKQSDTSRNLCYIFSYTYPGVPALRRKLVEYGVFNISLLDCSQEDVKYIIENQIKTLSLSDHPSDYFSKSLNKEVLENNRMVFARSEALKNYIGEQGVISLDDITRHTTKASIASIFGFKYGSSRLYREKMIKYRIFSISLLDYSQEDREHMVNTIIMRPANSMLKFKSSYFQDGLSEEIIQENLLAVLSSKTALEFLRKEKSHIDDIENSSEAAKNFFSKLGVYKTSDIKVPRTLEGPRYRVITKRWDEKEESELVELANRLGRDETRIIDNVLANGTELQERYGVSTNAILFKMEYLGLLPPTQFGDGPIDRIATYVFPRIHAEEYPDSIELYRNISTLLTFGRMPTAIPVLGFETAVHQQLHHATLPVLYKGIELENYNLTEQRIIATVHDYISNNENFTQSEDNIGDLVVPEEVHGDDVRIVRINGEGRHYAQLIFRRSFKPNNRTDTVALVDNGVTYLHFKHENTTFRNTRVVNNLL